MNGFEEVLKEQMKKIEISVEDLCEGLCSQSMFARICSGERSADKLLRERLMQRLGLSDTRNESFLFRDEYEEWKLRQQILNAINREQFHRAEELLQKYKSSVSMNNNLEQQFCMVMEMQILIGQGGGTDQVEERIERALKLTVPNIDTKPLHQLLLSEQEMDLVLEYVRYSQPEYLLQCCQELLEYIKRSIADEYIQAKIIPKIVYYQCMAGQAKEAPDWDMLLRNCNEAIACLRDTQRLYYFWELLGEREKLYEHFINKTSVEGENTHKEVFVRMQEENALWKQTLEEMYRDCGVSPAMKNSCYLYQTTLLRLILKQLTPSAGCIQWNDTSYDEISKASLLRRISYVAQSPMIFHKNVKENILAGREEDGNKLAKVLQQSNLTMCRGGMEATVLLGLSAREMSGGEKKRLAYARALYRDGDVLILDEFTSAVDEQMAEELETGILKKR